MSMLNSSPAPDCRRPSVLVVDDDRDSRETLTELLRLEGCEVRSAASGESCLQLAKKFIPDVVFLDIQMPQMNGYDVCRQLRGLKQFDHTRIVALSALSGPEHSSRCNVAGFDEVMVKPPQIDALMRSVH